MDFNAVLFDLDGTLLDTLDDLADSMNAALAELGFPPHPADEHRYFIGNGMPTYAARALPASHKDQETVTRLIKAMRTIYGRRWAEKTHLYDGIDEMLTALAERGMKLAVLSNKPDDFTKMCVRRFLGGHDFKIVQGVADGCPPKPDPTGATTIAETFGIPAGQFLYLGDTNTDMQTANAAGMYAIGVLWGFRTADELIKNGAKKLVSHPTELLKILSRDG